MLKWGMLAVYVLLIAYILQRSAHWFKSLYSAENRRKIVIPVMLVFLLVCSTLLLGGLLPKSSVQRHLRVFSNYWLALFIYLAFFMLCADILVIVLKLIDRKKKVSLLRQKKGYALIGTVIIGLSVFCTVYGLIHAKKLYTRVYDNITVEKSVSGKEELNIVLLGDLHLGYSVGCDYMEEMVERVNALEPDIVLIAGDIYDNDYDALDDPDRLAEILSGMKSTYGTYAVYGNHDVDELLIGGFPLGSGSHAYRDERLVEFTEKCGFHMLEDETVLIDDSFYVVGRIDEERDGNGTKVRKSIEELTEDLDQTKPVIVLTHEPSELDETAQSGADLLLCGHTHAGQFFPLTIVQPLAWKNYWGYLKVGDMQSFVTSGVGVYGPDIRVATNSEIMQIKVKFDGIQGTDTQTSES